MEEKIKKDTNTIDCSDRARAQEVLQDLFTMYICFNIQSKIKNQYIQEIYGYILVFFYSVFLHEMFVSGLVDENPNTDKAKEMMKKFRHRFLKRKPFQGKSIIEEITNEMEIDFDHFVYDIRLTVDEHDKNKLYSINLGVWDLLRLDCEKIDLFNTLACVPEKLIKDILSDFFGEIDADAILKIIDDACEICAEEIDKKISPIKYSYASGVLFKTPEPVEEDKYLILYYYTYFSLFSMLDEFFPPLKTDTKVIKLNIPYSLKKLKAMLVCAFGEKIMGKDTKIVCDIKRQIEEQYGGTDIFILNRRLRNNIHYEAVDLLSETELIRIDEFQRKYIQIVLSVFNDKIKFKFGRWYRFIKWIADHTDPQMLEKKKQIESESSYLENR